MAEPPAGTGVRYERGERPPLALTSGAVLQAARRLGARPRLRPARLRPCREAAPPGAPRASIDARRAALTATASRGGGEGGALRVAGRHRGQPAGCADSVAERR